MPYRLFPYIVLGWLLIGAAVVVFAPQLAARMSDGLTRTLGLPAPGEAARTPGAIAQDPPVAD